MCNVPLCFIQWALSCCNTYAKKNSSKLYIFRVYESIWEYNLLKFAPIKKIMPFISVTITAGLTSDPSKFNHVSINLNNSYLSRVVNLLFWINSASTWIVFPLHVSWYSSAAFSCYLFFSSYLQIICCRYLMSLIWR